MPRLITNSDLITVTSKLLRNISGTGLACRAELTEVIDAAWEHVTPSWCDDDTIHLAVSYEAARRLAATPAPVTSSEGSVGGGLASLGGGRAVKSYVNDKVGVTYETASESAKAAATTSADANSKLSPKYWYMLLEELRLRAESVVEDPYDMFPACF